jgi:hypothetical protein
MATSKSVPVEAIASYAHRSGEDIHLVVTVPEIDLADGPVDLRFSDGSRRFREAATARAEGSGAVIEARVPAARFGRPVWRIAVRSSEAEPFQPLQVRLLARADLPVALLPGPKPATRMAPPPPRSQGSRPAMLARRARRRLSGAVRRFRPLRSG